MRVTWDDARKARLKEMWDDGVGFANAIRRQVTPMKKAEQ